MRRVLFLVFLAIGCLTAAAQDFVSRYYTECEQDTALKCISISPRMMEEILKSNANKDEQEEMMNIISELKSMQILKSAHRGEEYYEKAYEMLERNNNRFINYASYANDDEDCQISIRKKKGVIIELVMLKRSKNEFCVINFTGSMNKDFIDRLVHTMAPHS